jgi:FtsZ-binding cell division protein ZapB
MNQVSERNESYLKRDKTDVYRKAAILIGILLVLLTAVIALFFMQRKEHMQIAAHLHKQKDSLRIELYNMVFKYDSLQTDNDTLNRQLSVAQNEVKDLLTRVKKIKKANIEQIARYQKEMNTLRQIMRHYIVQVDSLYQRNQFLLKENKEVKDEYKAIASRNQELKEEKRQLQQKVELAAVLEAKELSAEAINTRGRPVRYAKRADKIRVSLKLSKNVTAQRGTKKIYIRILRPDQLLLSTPTNDLFRFEELEILYSAMREVMYEGKKLPVNIFWDNKNHASLIGGTYKVDVFVDGYNIGSTNFSLR